MRLVAIPRRENAIDNLIRSDSVSIWKPSSLRNVPVVRAEQAGRAGLWRRGFLFLRFVRANEPSIARTPANDDSHQVIDIHDAIVIDVFIASCAKPPCGDHGDEVVDVDRAVAAGR